MRNAMHDKRFFMVAIVAGIVAMLPLFVVMAAQGQITEVNPSGVSGVRGTVSIDSDDDTQLPRDVTINASTSWKVIGKGQKSCRGKS